MMHYYRWIRIADYWKDNFLLNSKLDLVFHIEEVFVKKFGGIRYRKLYVDPLEVQ